MSSSIKAFRTIRAVALGLALLAMPSCLRDGGRSPNVILIVVDTLRVDRLGVYGNQRGLTPFIDSLAARGTVFDHAFTTTSWTCPAVASLMTSRFPVQHHVVNFASKLADEEVTLAETLHAARYVGGGFSANYRLLETLGYAQGFQHWRADFQPGKGARADELQAHALDWLDQVRRSVPDQPVLLYFQYMEPHAPYEPNEPFRTKFALPRADPNQAANANRNLVSMRWHELTRADVDLLASLYDAEVANLDAELGKLFGELEQRGLLHDAIVIVTGDHGEEFWEHGGLTHGTSLYNETVHVPLILVAPGYAGGQRVEENVSLVDVAPTLLDLLGLASEPRFEGRSLVPLLAPQSLSARLRAAWRSNAARPHADAVLQLEATGYGLDVREQTEGIVRESTKFMVRPGGIGEVYDLVSDPGEQTANSPGLEDQSSTLAQALQAERADLVTRAGARAEVAPLDDATREKLRALGYHF